MLGVVTDVSAIALVLSTYYCLFSMSNRSVKDRLHRYPYAGITIVQAPHLVHKNGVICLAHMSFPLTSRDGFQCLLTLDKIASKGLWKGAVPVRQLACDVPF